MHLIYFTFKGFTVIKQILRVSVLFKVRTKETLQTIDSAIHITINLLQFTLTVIHFLKFDCLNEKQPLL